MSDSFDGQRINVIMPPMPESEVTRHLQSMLKDYAERVASLEIRMRGMYDELCETSRRASDASHDLARAEAHLLDIPERTSVCVNALQGLTNDEVARLRELFSAVDEAIHLLRRLDPQHGMTVQLIDAARACGIVKDEP